MSFDLEKIYALLPTIYRIRDAELALQTGLLSAAEAQEWETLNALFDTLDAEQAERLAELELRRQAGPLKSLLGVISEQVAVIEEDLEQLYDDQFIETCAEWVVPYIGDLVGARNLHVWPGAELSNRAEVAHTIKNRRRKGTIAGVEQVARDVTGWPASVAEYFQLLATTQYMNHLRPANVVTPDLRRGRVLERLGTPFDSVPRNADVRRIEPRLGRYNIPNVGIFLWRIQSFELQDAPAYPVDGRRFLFNPLGLATRLFNRPQAEQEISHLATEENVPAPLGRRALDEEHERVLASGPGAAAAEYSGAQGSITLEVGGARVAWSEVCVCDLSDDGAGWAHAEVNDKHSIDPVLGRLRLAQTSAGASVRTTFHYGFSAEMGGGQYGRAESFVGAGLPVEVPTDEPDLQSAFDALGQPNGVVALLENGYHTGPLTTILAANQKVEIRSADERRAVVAVDGDWLAGGGEKSELTVNGVALMSGGLHVPPMLQNSLAVLRLRHCTLLPGPSPALGDLPAQAAAPRLVVGIPGLRVELDRCIVGAIRAVEGAEVRITNSIVDAGDEGETAYAAPDDVSAGAPLEIENCTVIGRVHANRLEASNTIFLAAPLAASPPPPAGAWVTPVAAARTQEGCVRFSYVPPGSYVPRRFQCQPQPAATPAQAERVRPTFTSLRYGDAGYCQLSRGCAVEIREGADDEAEMGAFHDLFQPQREANLRARLEEYLRFGLEAGIFYAS
jgi:hypothetical protein